MSDKKRCFVCMYTYDSMQHMNICPVCKFQEPHILGDYEQGVHELQPMIMKKKQDLLNKLRIGLVIFEYEISNGQVIEKGKSIEYFNNVVLLGETCWLNDQFETVSTRDSLEAEIAVTINNTPLSQKYTLPNLKDASCLTVGITVDNQFDLILIAKDESGRQTQSEKAYIFSGS